MRLVRSGVPIRSIFLSFICVLSALLGGSAAASEPELSEQDSVIAAKLLVQQIGEAFPEQEVQSFLYRKAPPELREYLLTSHYALTTFVTTIEFADGARYCWATVGLSELAAKGRTPRWPVHQLQSAVVTRDGSKCSGQALGEAINKLVGEPLATLQENIQLTLARGGTRAAEPADRSMVHVSSVGLDRDGWNEMFDAVSTEFRAAFDYRLAQLSALGNSFTFEDEMVCLAVAGLVARAPSDRQPRMPAVWRLSAHRLTKEEAREDGAEQKCVNRVVRTAVADHLKRSWDAHGILGDFKLTREDGLALVKPVGTAMHRRPPRAEPLRTVASSPTRVPANGSCQPPAGQTLRYHDRCFNGSCTRTFDNGCTIRFQAPYCYDVLSGSWTWKPNGC